jgi:archaellum component FlaC
MVDAKSVYLTQFRILETVNRILTNIESSNGSGNQNNQNEVIDEINHRTDQILYEENEMKELLEDIKQTVQYTSENVERDSQKFEYKINSVETKINQKVNSEINKVLSELRNVKEENKKLKEGIRYLAKNASNQPNIWFVVAVTFFLNMLGLYIIVRVLPNRGSGDLFKTHNY